MACEMDAPVRPAADPEDEEAGPALGAALTRDAILAASDLGIESVAVPEWGGHVFVRVMTGRERDAFEAQITSEGGVSLKDFRARFAAAVLCDADGNRLFRPEDVDALTMKGAPALDRVFEVGKRINRIGREEQEALVRNFA